MSAASVVSATDDRSMIGSLLAVRNTTLRCHRHAIVPQKRVQLRRASPECHKRLECRPATASRKHLIPESGAHGGRQDALFLEDAVGVGGEHLGPFVAVIAGGVAAVEDMSEAVDGTIVIRTRNDGDLASNGCEERFGTLPWRARVGIVIGVQ